MTRTPKKTPPTLKQRFENHPVPYIIGICAVVVVAMASLAGYLTTNALAVQKGELEELFRADTNKALAELRADDGSPDVFVIRCAFLSNGRDVENSSDWANVFNWWSRLVIQA